MLPTFSNVVSGIGFSRLIVVLRGCDIGAAGLRWRFHNVVCGSPSLTTDDLEISFVSRCIKQNTVLCCNLRR